MASSGTEPATYLNQLCYSVPPKDWKKPKILHCNSKYLDRDSEQIPSENEF
jgi:hypothetical protein